MKFLVLLAGCGIVDGSAIEEVILVYTTLDKYNISYVPIALNKDYISINHFTKKNSEVRNILFESARIGRGLIQNFLDLKKPIATMCAGIDLTIIPLHLEKVQICL